jgi:hypothetical protein
MKRTGHAETLREGILHVPGYGEPADHSEIGMIARVYSVAPQNSSAP